MEVKLKTITPGAEVNIVEIARVSSSRTDKAEKPEGLINYLIKNKHWSPFEHAYMTVEIVTSKAIGIQLLRHVSFRFQEFSQRYAKVEAMETIELRKQADKNRQSSTDYILNIELGKCNYDESPHPDYQDIKYHILFDKVRRALDHTFDLYNELLEAGVAKECARMILPMATQTTIYMTGSIRSWIHMLEIRDDGHAQKEVQLIAKEIKKLFINELPIISNALNWNQDGLNSNTSITGGQEGATLPGEGSP